MQNLISKAKKIYINNYNKRFFSILLNLLILLLFNNLFYCEFSTNDDITMARIANGFFGVYDEHLIFINAIIGKFFKIMYSILPSICWYEFFYYACSCFSFVIIYYIFSQQSIKKSCVGLIAIIVAGYSAYCQPQFTKLSAYLACAGYLHIYYFIFNKENKIDFIGIFFLLLSFMVRNDSFFFVSFIWTFVYLFKCVDNIRKKKNNVIINLVKEGVICLLILLAVFAIDKSYYQDEEWKNYCNFNSIRSQLLDYILPSYEENEELYNNLNINETAFNLLNNWNCDDYEVFSNETMLSLSEHANSEFKLNTVPKFLYSFSIYCFTKPYMILYISLLILICYQFFKNKEKENILIIFLSLLAAIICIFYVFLKRNSIMSRVNYGAIFSIIVLAINIANFDNVFDKKFYIKIFVIMFLFCFAYGKELKIFNKEKIDNNTSINETLSYFEKNNDCLYMLNVNDSFYNSYELFSDYKTSSGNVVFLGGWQSRAPFQTNILSKYGITNPYRDMVDNDKCLIINSEIDLIVTYIRDYYNSNAKAIVVDNINGFNIYKIVSK